MRLRPAALGTSLAALMTTVLASAPALSEGARVTFSCIDDTGRPRAVTIAPTEIDETGAGRVTITLDARESPGVAAGHLGGFSWDRDGTVFTLYVSGLSDAGLDMVLHSLDTNQTPPLSDTNHLTCEAPT